MASPDDSQLRAEVVLGQWCRTLFSGLISAGVRHVVISPGSRSTPLVMQALQESALECHPVLDERSAGFFALGLASLGGPPPVLICTSGTALAHYLPAVIEARMSGLPLLILSADRPAELQECGAAQTIAQEHVLSPYARSGPPLGAMSERTDALLSLLRKSIQTVALSRGPLPGPVHLNFPVAKPLEIEEPASEGEHLFFARVSQLIARTPALPPTSVVVPHEAGLLDALADLLADGKRTCVTLGPAKPDVVRLALDFARRIGAPLLTELSPLKDAQGPLDTICSHWQRSAADFLPPERVIHLGLPCISTHWLRFLETTSVELWCVPGPEWKDPSNRARRMILGDLSATLVAMNRCLEESLMSHVARAGIHGTSAGSNLHGANVAPNNSFPEFAQQLAACEHSRELALTHLGHAGSAAQLPEVLACGTILESIPQGSNVLLGNSLSLRLAAWVDRGRAAECQFFVQRGVNGIDGQIARSAGIAHGSGLPTLAILGDVTAAHDLGSLLVAREIKVPLVIAVLDNDGGRLFDHLPLAKKVADQENYRFWTTPPRINWEAAAAAYGALFKSCSTVSSIAEAVVLGLATPGTTLIHLSVDAQSTHAFLSMSRSPA